MFEAEADSSSFQRYAQHDKTQTVSGHGTGYYQCFCQKYSTWYRSLYEDYGKKDNFCYDFHKGIVTGKASTLTVTIVIAVVNILLRNFNKELILRIGYGQEGQQFRMITMAIFWTSFFNSAILLVLANASFKPYPFSFIPLAKQFPDQTTKWYVMMGPALVQTALVLAVFPYINWSLFYAIRLVRRFRDSGFGCCKSMPPTKLKNVTQFVELYSGQDIFMYFKYSNIMVLTFCAFTHGIAFPVLWPIALFGLINNYLVERICLAYYYK